MPLTFLLHDRPKDMRPVRARLYRSLIDGICGITR